MNRSLIQLATSESQEEVDISDFEAEWDPVAEAKSAILWDACTDVADQIELHEMHMQRQTEKRALLSDSDSKEKLDEEIAATQRTIIALKSQLGQIEEAMKRDK